MQKQSIRPNDTVESTLGKCFFSKSLHKSDARAINLSAEILPTTTLQAYRMIYLLDWHRSAICEYGCQNCHCLSDLLVSTLFISLNTRRIYKVYFTVFHVSQNTISLEYHSPILLKCQDINLLNGKIPLTTHKVLCLGYLGLSCYQFFQSLTSPLFLICLPIFFWLLYYIMTL